MDLENVPGANSKKAQASRGRVAKSTREGLRIEGQFGAQSVFAKAEGCWLARHVPGHVCEFAPGTSHVEFSHWPESRGENPKASRGFAACDLGHRLSDGRAKLPNGRQGKEAFREWVLELTGIDLRSEVVRIQGEFKRWCRARGLNPAPGKLGGKRALRQTVKKVREEEVRAKAHAQDFDQFCAEAAEQVDALIETLKSTRCKRTDNALPGLYHARTALREKKPA